MCRLIRACTVRKLNKSPFHLCENRIPLKTAWGREDIAFFIIQSNCYFLFLICSVFSKDPYFGIYCLFHLTHFSLEIPKSVTDKQCRPRPDAAECRTCSGSPLFVNRLAIFLYEYLNHIA